jgi:hypothetical protein
VIVLVLSVISLRFYHASITGFLLPDEAWYFNTFVLRGQQMGDYRQVFVIVYLLFFRGVRDVSTFLLRGAVYSAIWAVGSVVMTYKIVRLLEVADKTAALLVLSLPLFPVFIVMMPFVVTETFGLFLSLIGVYFAVRFFSGFSALDAFLSSLGFMMAYQVREPYLIFAVGTFVLIMLSGKRSVPAILAYAVPLFLFFPLVVSLTPLQLGQPIYMYVPSLLEQWFRNASPIVAPQSVTAPAPTNAEFLHASIVSVPFASGLNKVPEVLYAFTVGLLLGFNPLFAIFSFVSLGLITYVLATRKSTIAGFSLLVVGLALLSYLLTLFIVVGTLARPLSLWTSTIFRMSHISLPALFGFNYLYERVKTRHLAGLLLIFVLLASTQVPQFLFEIQSALSGPLQEPIDRLSFNYRAPYYRLYLIAKDSGRTLVFSSDCEAECTTMRGIEFYMSMLPNVKLAPVPPNSTAFKVYLDQGWDTVFLYDNWYTIKDPSRAVREQWYPPYYLDILLQKRYQGYCVETLWVDGESYALRMVKASAGSCGSGTEDYAQAFSIQSTLNSMRPDGSVLPHGYCLHGSFA